MQRERLGGGETPCIVLRCTRAGARRARVPFWGAPCYDDLANRSPCNALLSEGHWGSERLRAVVRAGLGARQALGREEAGEA